MDSLIFLPDPVKAAAELQESLSARRDSNAQEPKKDISAKEPEVEVQVENVERPVDLYKAIFSDDSEDEATNIKRPEDQEKMNQAAATTLNRLMAGDFLESLGKELGLEVPPDVVHPETKPSQKEGSKAKSVEEDKSLKGKMEAGPSQNGPNNKPGLEEIAQEEEKNDLSSGFKQSHSEDEKNWNKREKLLYRSQQSESSEDEQKRKRSKRHKRRTSDSDSSSSSDYRDRHGSRSKEKRKESSREKSRSWKKHSKHYKHHRSKKSSSSRHSTDTDTDGEREESRKEKRRRKRRD